MACLVATSAIGATVAFAAGSGDWVDDNFRNSGPRPGTITPQHVHLSDQARQEAEKESEKEIERETMQSVPPEEDWDADRKSRMQQQQSQSRPMSQADQLPPVKKSGPLEGGVTSSVDNFGVSQNLRDIKEQDSHMFSLYAGSPPPFPEPKIVSPTVFKNWLKTTHAELPVTDKNAIVEIKGQWDDSGHILHTFGWLSTKVNSNSVAKFDFSHTYVAIVDCAGNLNQDAIERLRAFVWDGGYLVSTDWALDNFVVKAFPGAIEWNGGYSYPDLVDAIIVEPNPDLIKGCVPHARWKLDDKCQTVKVRLPQFVHVLVRSPMLARQDPDGRGILAASFQYGRGQVLHVVGHFDINSAGTFTNSLPDPAPRIGIGLRQAIIANFIATGIEAHVPPTGSQPSSDSDSKPAGESKKDDSSMEK